MSVLPVRSGSFFCLLLLLLLGIPGTNPFASAQGEGVDSGGLESPYERSRRPVKYFGLGGGYLGMYTGGNDPRLNAIAQNLGLAPIESVTLHGGGGYVGFPGLRLGFYSVGGSAETSRNLSVNDLALRRTLRFERHVVAGHLEVPIRILPALHLFPGLMIGGETNAIALTQFSEEGIPFDTLFDAAPFDGTAPVSLSTLSYNIARHPFHLQPTLSAEFGLIPHILILRAGGGYAWSLGGEWKNSSGGEVGNGPEFNGYFTLHFGASLDIAGLFLVGLSKTFQDGLN